MRIDVDALIAPPTHTAALAAEAARRWCSEDLFNHSLRAWVWARTLGDSLGLDYDPELLFVASLLHDVGVVDHFDSHTIPFETAGGAVAWMFAAGAGWPESRRQRVMEVVERHMWVEVDPKEDVEGHLLEVSTSLDVGGVGFEHWSPELMHEITAAVPRGGFSACFAAAIDDQAARKPESNASRLSRAGRVSSGAAAWAAFADGRATG